jgi:hypothetical protein
VRALAGLLVGLCLGCAGIEVAELPEAPIAFVFRNVEETERLLEEVRARREAEKPRAENEIDVDLAGLEKLTGRRTRADLERDQQGRVALYLAPARRLELPDAIGRGARPLDWSADHTRLLFVSMARGVPHLFEWIVATGEVRQLTTGAEGQVDGCYGPAGALAWVQQDGAARRTRLWVRFPGEAPRAITAGPADLEPAWSPDGERIVFTRSHPREGSTLRWIDPKSGAEGGLGRGASPSFSPDGEWIVYSGRTTAGSRLQRMRADGSGRRSLGASGFHEYDPAVSPDGRFVVFVAVKDPSVPLSRLFVRTIDGATDRQLEVAGSGLLPVW